MGEENTTEVVLSDQQRKKEYKNLLKYTGIFGGVQGLNLLSSLIRNKLSALLLGPSGLGMISLFLSVTTMIGNASNLGISFSGVRSLSEASNAEDREKLTQSIRTVRCWSSITALLGMLLCFFLAPLLSRWTFDVNTYTIHFRLLSVVIGITALTGGELAILKGVRRLKEVAYSSVIATFLSIFLIIPLYYLFRQDAIVPALIIVSVLTFVFTARYSLRVEPLSKETFSMKQVKAGKSIVHLGISFILAGVMGAIVEYLIRTIILHHGSVEVVGYYNTGLVLCVSYMGMIYVAIDNDYFSKLSAIHQERSKVNELVNSQIELSLLLITPLLSGLLLSLPLIVRALYSSDFIAVVPMVRYAWLFMFLKGYNLAMAYIALAKGDAKAFLGIELICHVANFLFCFVGYLLLDIAGLGIGLSAAAFCEAAVLSVFCHRKYHFRFAPRLGSLLFSLLPVIIVSFLLSAYAQSGFFWPAAGLCFLAATAISGFLLEKRTGLIGTFLSKIKR